MSFRTGVLEGLATVYIWWSLIKALAACLYQGGVLITCVFVCLCVCVCVFFVCGKCSEFVIVYRVFVVLPCGPGSLIFVRLLGAFVGGGLYIWGKFTCMWMVDISGES